MHTMAQAKRCSSPPDKAAISRSFMWLKSKNIVNLLTSTSSIVIHDVTSHSGKLCMNLNLR